MKVNSEKLFEYINNLGTDEKVKFKVYYDDVFTRIEIFWDGENFIWESGNFTSGMFFDPLYSFEEIIEDNKEIPELDIQADETTPNSFYITNKAGTRCYLTKHSKIMADKINELVREINRLRQ